jgi:hypothetical protein
VRALLVLLLLTSVAYADYQLRPRTPRVPPAPRPKVTVCPDKTITQRVIDSHLPAIRDCWARAWTEHEVEVSARFVVAGNGRVVEVVLTGATKPFEACLAKVIRGMRFPALGATTAVAYPFHFKR